MPGINRVEFASVQDISQEDTHRCYDEKLEESPLLFRFHQCEWAVSVLKVCPKRSCKVLSARVDSLSSHRKKYSNWGPVDHKPFHLLRLLSLPAFNSALPLFASVTEGNNSQRPGTSVSGLPASIAKAATGKRWRFKVLKWKASAPLTPVARTCYIYFNETLSVTGLQAAGFEGWRFPETSLERAATALDAALTQATRYQHRDLRTNDLHCIYIHFNLAKVFEYMLHLFPHLLQGFYAICSIHYIEM